VLPPVSGVASVKADVAEVGGQRRGSAPTRPLSIGSSTAT
jgi:hypothetical protein